MNYFVADGEEARKQAEETNTPRQKTNYLKLGANESIKVMILDPKFPCIMEHGDFNLKIPSHLCTNPTNVKPQDCPSCAAGIKRSKKYVIPFTVVEGENAGQLVWWSTSKKHAQAVYSAVDLFGDEDVVNEVFVLKRTGAGPSDTAYSLMPLPPKQRASVKIPDHKPLVYGSQERSDLYNSVIRPASEEYIQKILAQLNTNFTAVEGQGTDTF